MKKLTLIILIVAAAAVTSFSQRPPGECCCEPVPVTVSGRVTAPLYPRGYSPVSWTSIHIYHVSDNSEYFCRPNRLGYYAVTVPSCGYVLISASIPETSMPVGTYTMWPSYVLIPGLYDNYTQNFEIDPVY